MLASFPLVMSSCSWFGGEEDDNTLMEQRIQEKKVGTLKSLGGISVSEATHLLEMKDDSTMRLKSPNIDLDNEKYLNNKVEVRGYISKTEDNRDIMEVMSIDIAEEQKEDEDKKIGEEKEYKNTDLGFTLTYLDNWDVEEEENSVIFEAPVKETEEEETSRSGETEETDKEPDTVVIRQMPNPGNESLAEYLNLPSDPNELITEGYTETQVGPDQLEGLKKQSPDQQEIDIYLARDPYIYQFTFEGGGNPDTALNRNTYFTMVSSFKFIGFTPEDKTEDDEQNEDETTETEEEDSAEMMEAEEPQEEEADTANNLETEETTYEEEPETSYDTDSGSVSSSYSVVAQYLDQNIDSIAPESSESGSWSATKYEFVDPNYVYVEYSDGSENRKVLLSYNSEGSSLNTEVIGYFEPGETASWTRVSGDNPVSGEEKTVVSVSDGDIEEEAVVKEGYRYFESLPYDFVAQYPSDWYYSGSSGSGDVLHHYGFSDEPVESGNEIISIDVVSGGMPSGSSISVGPHTGVKVYENGDVAVYIERDDGRIYKVHAASEYETSVIDIAASIQEN